MFSGILSAVEGWIGAGLDSCEQEDKRRRRGLDVLLSRSVPTVVGHEVTCFFFEVNTKKEPMSQTWEFCFSF